MDNPIFDEQGCSFQGFGNVCVCVCGGLSEIEHPVAVRLWMCVFHCPIAFITFIITIFSKIQVNVFFLFLSLSLTPTPPPSFPGNNK